MQEVPTVCKVFFFFTHKATSDTIRICIWLVNFLIFNVFGHKGGVFKLQFPSIIPHYGILREFLKLDELTDNDTRMMFNLKESVHLKST